MRLRRVNGVFGTRAVRLRRTSLIQNPETLAQVAENPQYAHRRDERVAIAALVESYTTLVRFLCA